MPVFTHLGVTLSELYVVCVIVVTFWYVFRNGLILF